MKQVSNEKPIKSRESFYWLPLMLTFRSTVSIWWVRSITPSLGNPNIQCFWSFNFMFLKLTKELTALSLAEGMFQSKFLCNLPLYCSLNLLLKLNIRGQLRNLRNLTNSPLEYAVYDPCSSFSFYTILQVFPWDITGYCNCALPAPPQPVRNTEPLQERSQLQIILCTIMCVICHED